MNFFLNEKFKRSRNNDNKKIFYKLLLRIFKDDDIDNLFEEFAIIKLKKINSLIQCTNNDI